jgi:hypothetical protein
MRQPRKNQSFTPKTLAPRRMAKGSAEKHLDGDIPVEIVIMCFPHFTHTTLPDYFEEAVPSENGSGLKGMGGTGDLSHAGKTSSIIF